MAIMATMRPPMMLSRVARRCLSTRGPRGPRGLLDKSRTPSRISRTPKASPLPQSNRHQSSQQKDLHQKPNEIPQPKPDEGVQQQPAQEPSKNALISTALAENESSDLVAPVRIPDDPDGILTPDHPAWPLLNNSSLVIQRQIEMMNVFLGFEQANKYVIMNGRGETIGYMAEQDHGLGTAMARQAFKTHRSFTSHIFDKNEREVLRIHRPFAWINSRIRIYDPSSSPEPSQSDSLQDTVPQVSAAQISSTPLSEMRIIGEAQQQWAPLRRKYNLFSYRPLESSPDSETPKLTSGDIPNTETKALTLSSVPEQAIEAGMTQFAHVNEPFLSWDFTLKNADDSTIGSVNRNFVGFARELFTDTGVYALRMDSASLTQNPEGSAEQETAMTLDQRAVMLATAVSIDFDYFSRHSGVGGGGFMPLWFPMGGGAAEGGAAGGAVGGAAGEAGVIGGAEGAGSAVGGAARGVAGTEGVVAGAGTMAGYEAMRQGRGVQQDDASPTANEPFDNDGGAPPQEQGAWGESQDPWGESQDPWNQSGNSGGDVGGSSGGGSGGGDGGGFDWGDFF